MGICTLDSSGSRKGPMAGCYANGNEHSGYLEYGSCLTSWATSSVFRRTDLIFLTTATILIVNLCSVRKAPVSERLWVLNTATLQVLLQSLPVTTEASLKIGQNRFHGDSCLLTVCSNFLCRLTLYKQIFETPYVWERLVPCPVKTAALCTRHYNRAPFCGTSRHWNVALLCKRQQPLKYGAVCGISEIWNMTFMQHQPTLK